MKKANKKKILRYTIIMILSLIVISGIVYISIKLYTDNKEDKDYSSLSEYMKEETGEENKDKEKTEKMIKLEELHKENEDIIAWLEIPDTKISYPVLQTGDNEYYLTHNYKKEYSASGSIFLDKDVDIEKPSSNFLMYGHRNKKGIMFEDLLKFKDKEFYENHKKIKFTTLNEDTEYEILAVFYSRVYYADEVDVFRYYYFVDAENEEEYNEFVENAKRVSIYDTGVEAKYGDTLITLSTCNYHTEDRKICCGC